ncbi:MAG: tetratricopeptide repeat protein [Pirellulaceae bacterium]|nr:tetratricopeptide repeat protein [Pirellulaceae bacterium]
MIKLVISVCVSLCALMQAAPTQTDQKSSRQLYEQAAKAIASADPKTAISPLEQLIEDQPTSALATVAVVHLAECYVASDRPRDAAALLEKWSSRIVTASKTTKLDANLDAHHLRVWLQAAKRIVDDGDSIQSLAALTDSLASRNEPADKVQLQEMLIDARVEMARRSMAAGKLDFAAKQLSQLTESTAETSTETQLLVAMIHQQLGAHTQAKKALQALIDSEPKTLTHSLACLELATYALQERELESAAKWLSPMIDSPALHHGLDQDSDCRFRILWSELELALGHAAHGLEVLPGDEELAKLSEPQQVAVRFSRAEAASQAGKNALALKDLQWLSSYATTAQNEPQWAVTVTLRQCELLLKTKDYSKLVTAVEDAKKRFPRFDRLHEFDYLLARASVQQIDFDQARLHLKTIVDTAGNSTSASARAQWMLGETYFMEQNFNEAVSAYKPVTELEQSQPWQTLALMQTAKCFELLNQPSDALDVYRRVVKITKDEKIRQEATARIEVVERTASRSKPAPVR